jgi:hypothetical protein
LEGSFFDGDVGVEVGGGGADVGVTEPEGDDGGVDAVVEQVHGAGVSEHVGVDLVGGEGRVA